MRYHVFLSYSHSDTDVMSPLRDDLKQVGLRVWTDENLTPGTPAWEDAIEESIEASGCMVVILTPNARRSEWVKREVNYAIIHDKRVFPILMKGDERSSIPIALIRTHYADIRLGYKPALQSLISAIKELLGRLPTFDIKLEKDNPKRLIRRIATQSFISVIIVDDVYDTRDSIKAILSLEDDFKVIGEASSGQEGVELVIKLQPDIVLMDINMPDIDGISATGSIFRAVPQVAIIMLSVQQDPEYIRRAMLAGARSYLTKPVIPDDLCNTIREVHRANKLRLE